MREAKCCSILRVNTISHALMKALRNGVRRCSDDALERLRGFVAGQWHGSGGFCDRSGKPDIYYTQFGLMLARALGMKIDASAVERFCWAHDVRSFDLVHASCFVRSLLLAKPWFSWMQRRRIRRDCPFAALVEAAQTPYERFLALTLAQDAGLAFGKKSLEAYRSADGLYANVSEALEGGVNATASAILVELLECDSIQNHTNWAQFFNPNFLLGRSPSINSVWQRPTKQITENPSPGGAQSENGDFAPSGIEGQRGRYHRALSCANDIRLSAFFHIPSAAHVLAELERDDGSFCANPSTHFPDILSTASAHFALHAAGMKPRNDAKVFVEGCFVEDAGGFAASPEGGAPDLEYTAYGVILMGMADY